MELMVYEAPDGSLVFGPTVEQMADIVLHTDHDYWQQGGNGEAALRVARQPGDHRKIHCVVTTPQGVKAEYLAGEPELWMKQPEPGWFFFTWNGEAEGWLVPYDGSACESFVMDERGGNPFKIARACLVDRRRAVEIVLEFLRSRGRSEAVRWLPWSDLPLPQGWE
jgi:hypothetical protein